MALNTWIKALNLNCRISTTSWIASKSNLQPTSANFFTSSYNAKSKTDDQTTLPVKPKRPLTPYLKFVQDHKSEILEKYNINKSKVTDLAKKCGEEWSKTDASIKEKYEKDYKEEFDKYQKQINKYSSELTEEQKILIEKEHERKLKNKAKLEMRHKMQLNDKPKKPPTSFTLYLMDEAQLQNKTLPKMMSEMKGAWNLLDETKKGAYISQYEKLKTQYDKDLLNWELKMLKLGNDDLVRYKTILEHGSAEKISKIHGEKKKDMFKKSIKDSEGKKPKLHKKD